LKQKIRALTSTAILLTVSAVCIAVALFDGLEIVFPRTYYITLYTISAMLAIYHFHIKKNPISLGSTLLLTVLVSAAIYHLYSVDIEFYREAKNFPATRRGREFFSTISTPVLIFRSILKMLNFDPGWPIGLGLGIAILLGCWGAVLLILSFLGSTLRLTSEGRDETIKSPLSPKDYYKIHLALVCLIAFGIRIPIILRYPIPVGVDTPFYIATMEGGTPFWRYPGITRLSYFFFLILGATLRTPFPIPASQILLIELIPLALHILAAVATYGAARSFTGDSRIGLVASTFSALSTSQILHSWDLYKALLAISATLFAAQFYAKALERQTVRETAISLIMLATAGLLHPYPASSLLYAILAFLPIQLLLSVRGRRISFKVTGSILIILAVIIFPILGGRLARPWPDSPVTPIWDMWDIFDSLGAQTFPLILVGIVCSLNTHKEKGLFLLTWFAVAFILAQQTLFQTYFPVDSPRFPRFLLLAYVPSTILAATALRSLLNPLRRKLSTNISFTVDLSISTLVIVSCVITALGFVAFGNPGTINMQEYNTVLWMIDHTPEYTNSLAPSRFDTWTGYYAGLQSQESRHFYTINIENDRSTIYNRIFDSGTYIHFRRDR